MIHLTARAFELCIQLPARQPTRLNLGLSCLFATCLAACGDPLVEPQVVEATRVFGVHLESADEPERAELARGEAGRLSFLLAATEASPVSGLVHICRASASTLGAPPCEGQPLLTLEMSGSSGSELSQDFELPDALRAGDEWLAWAGFCEEALPSAVTSEHFECDNGEPALESYARFRVPDGAANMNPSLDDDRLRLEGVTWSDEPLLKNGSACADSDLPRVSDEQTVEIRFALQGDDREPLPAEEPSYGQATQESLVYSHAATVPGLSRAFSAIDHNSDNAGFELSFTPELNSGARNGRTATLFFVVRDGRGGSDWLLRQLCIMRGQ